MNETTGKVNAAKLTFGEFALVDMRIASDPDLDAIALRVAVARSLFRSDRTGRTTQQYIADLIKADRRRVAAADAALESKGYLGRYRTNRASDGKWGASDVSVPLPSPGSRAYVSTAWALDRRLHVGEIRALLTMAMWAGAGGAFLVDKAPADPDQDRRLQIAAVMGVTDLRCVNRVIRRLSEVGAVKFHPAPLHWDRAEGALEIDRARMADPATLDYADGTSSRFVVGVLQRPPFEIPEIRQCHGGADFWNTVAHETSHGGAQNLGKAAHKTSASYTAQEHPKGSQGTAEVNSARATSCEAAPATPRTRSRQSRVLRRVPEVMALHFRGFNPEEISTQMDGSPSAPTIRELIAEYEDEYRAAGMAA